MVFVNLALLALVYNVLGVYWAIGLFLAAWVINLIVFLKNQ